MSVKGTETAAVLVLGLPLWQNCTLLMVITSIKEPMLCYALKLCLLSQRSLRSTERFVG